MSAATAFEIAARLGYDGIEIMVSNDPVSQDVEALRKLSDYHGLPVTSLHAPCLLITARVWGTDPWEKLRLSQQAAERLGAQTVVVHPPFVWQRDYARTFREGIARMESETDVRFAVENMFPLRARGRAFSGFAPDWDPTEEDYRHFTLDLSHTATAQNDALQMAAAMGRRLAHVHVADGVGGTNRDEHLVPGRGGQPCAELLEGLPGGSLTGHPFTGSVVVEVNTHRAADAEQREADLAEALAFTRRHLARATPAAAAGRPGRPGGRAPATT
ncbi:MAG: sugar phosphate isomerase/epimerase [Actinomycetota bacterium]|nr:sugar phosphate isomerase/epimerase [Actinomycetota bacterium]